MYKQTPIINFSDLKNDIRLELTVVGYQFPDESLDNWCLLNATISQENNVFVVNDPAIEAIDLVNILDWFKCIHNRQLPRYATLTFIEPCIEFNFIACCESYVRIAISLNNEMQPDFKFKQFGITLENCNLCFDLNLNDFNLIISNLESLVQLYPFRRKNLSVPYYW